MPRRPSLSLSLTHPGQPGILRDEVAEVWEEPEDCGFEMRLLFEPCVFEDERAKRPECRADDDGAHGNEHKVAARLCGGGG